LQVQVLSPLPPTERRRSTTIDSRKYEPTVLTGMRRYVGESWAELKKVVWPTRETVIRLTILVVAVSLLVGIYIYVLDSIFNTVLDQVLRSGG
jgi:preprotein translocase SecE subunit